MTSRTECAINTHTVVSATSRPGDSHKNDRNLARKVRVPSWQSLYSTLRHNGHDGVSNYQPHDCLLNRLFRCRSKKTSKLRVTGLCAGKSPGTGEFPAQMDSYAENVSIWWRHHDFGKAKGKINFLWYLYQLEITYIAVTSPYFCHGIYMCHYWLAKGGIKLNFFTLMMWLKIVPVKLLYLTRFWKKLVILPV